MSDFLLGVLSSSTSDIALSFLTFKDEMLSLAGKINMTNAAMCDALGSGECRDKDQALYLKLAAMVAILFTGVLGVALPLFGKRLTCLRTDKGFFLIAKAFAAGVVLATAFVHILPDAMEVLRSPCLPEVPWKRFPFGGFIAMISAMGTLLVDLLSTGFFERRSQEKSSSSEDLLAEEINSNSANSDNIGHHYLETDVEQPQEQHHQAAHKSVQVKLHIVGMHAHAAAHSHKHPEGQHGKDAHTLDENHFGHSHMPSEFDDEDDEFTRIRHIIISQVLELGIITHSIIIGVSLGVSQSPCTIRPLLGALSFHQFFEGFALGGCISQAGFKPVSVIIMAAFFAITTPAGIALGIGISEVYNPNSVQALVVEGMFYSVSAGILVYMALVNLIAADFLSKRMRCDQRLQTLSLLSLFLGGLLMSMLAFWV